MRVKIWEFLVSLHYAGKCSLCWAEEWMGHSFSGPRAFSYKVWVQPTHVTLLQLISSFQQSILLEGSSRSWHRSTYLTFVYQRFSFIEIRSQNCDLQLGLFLLQEATGKKGTDHLKELRNPSSGLAVGIAGSRGSNGVIRTHLFSHQSTRLASFSGRPFPQHHELPPNKRSHPAFILHKSSGSCLPHGHFWTSHHV